MLNLEIRWVLYYFTCSSCMAYLYQIVHIAHSQQLFCGGLTKISASPNHRSARNEPIWNFQISPISAILTDAMRPSW